MIDRFKFRVYVNQNDEYPERKGYVNTEDFYIHPDGDVGFFNADYDFAEYIIEQCTGLKDKNGKLIYENDIVTDGKEAGRIYWYKTGWAVTMFLWQHDTSELEVIGNIHENPELLEEKTE